MSAFFAFKRAIISSNRLMRASTFFLLFEGLAVTFGGSGFARLLFSSQSR